MEAAMTSPSALAAPVVPSAAFVLAPLPMTPEQLTRDWLGAALAQRYPGTEVTGLEQGAFVSGTATKIQLLLTYNEAGRAHGLPPSMIAKGGFDWHEVAFKESYQAEARFYADWRPRIDANLPKCFHAVFNDSQGIALIEDLGLRRASFGRATVPLGADVMQQTMDLLARIHAPWWNHPSIRSLRSLGERVGKNFVSFMLEPKYYAQCVSEKRGSTVPKAFRDPQRVLAGLKANWAHVDTGPQTFVHGDPHQGNLFFDPDGTPGYLDFQAYVRSSALHDVNYVVVGSMTVEDRRKHDRDLVKYYLSRLAAYGVRDAWSFEEAWERYRRCTMHGMLWFATPPVMQPADVVEATGIRFGIAAEDYRLAQALGV